MKGDWRGILSGERRDAVARLCRLLLEPIAWIYEKGVAHRNNAFASGRRSITRVGATVISIGNITTGGTGKTPLVIWMAEYLQSIDQRVGIISRGYGAKRGETNDEAKEIASRLPHLPHLQNPDRIAAAKQLLAEQQVDSIILDDGFQHRRIHRDLDIVLIDATCPWGYGHLLPRGLLREPAEQLSRADVVVLTRRSMVDDATALSIRQRAQQLAPQAIWVETSHEPLKHSNNRGEVKSLDCLSGKRVFGFCAIGNPRAFEQTIEDLGAEIVGWQEFPDHHFFTRAELASLHQQATQTAADCLVCTKKDMVKLPLTEPYTLETWCVEVGLCVLTGENALRAAIQKITARCPMEQT